MRHDQFLIKRILFATDFSSCADHAEQYVAFFSKVFEATVDVIHVLETYADMYATVQDHRETDDRVAGAVRRLQQPMIPVTGHQMMGIPSVLICEAAVKYHAELIVLGTHGRTGLEHILLGSTAERVLTLAPCPVLTVREPKGSEGPPKLVPIKFQHVTIPIDFSDCSLDALEYAIQIAKGLAASLTLLHVLEPVSYDVTLSRGHEAKDEQERVTSHLTALASMIQSHGLSVREVIRGGLPADSILEFACASGCELLVMGTHGRRGIAHVMQGSVTEAVLRRASCPVLAVRRLRLASGHQRVVRLPAVPVGVTDELRTAGTIPSTWPSRAKKKSSPFLASGWPSLKRPRVVMALMGLLAISLVLFLGPCPWPACRYWNRNTYTIRTLDEYRQFVSHEAEFAALHRHRAVTVDCSSVRDDVVGMLQRGRLMLGSHNEPSMVQPGFVRAWREDRILHLANTMLESPQELETWAVNIRDMVASQKRDELAVLPRLFGGAIIHIHGKQNPMVLISDAPCL